MTSLGRAELTNQIRNPFPERAPHPHVHRCPPDTWMDMVSGRPSAGLGVRPEPTSGLPLGSADSTSAYPQTRACLLCWCQARDSAVWRKELCTSRSQGLEPRVLGRGGLCISYGASGEALLLPGLAVPSVR